LLGHALIAPNEARLFVATRTFCGVHMCERSR
jgi:hypothetical protein